MTYRAIAASEKDAESPVTVQLIEALDSNLGAVLAAETDAPYDQMTWHPYDGVTVGDGNTGELWDFATDGAVTTVTSPDFTAGYEYRFILQDVECGGGVVNLAIYRATGAAWTSAVTITDTVTYEVNGTADLFRPMVSATVLSGYGLTVSRGEAAGLITALNYELGSSGDTCGKARLGQTGLGFDGGTIYLYRRRIY